MSFVFIINSCCLGCIHWSCWKIGKQKSAFSETMEVVTIYTIDFELRQNKNDSAAYWSPSCLLHLSVVRQSCSEEGIKEKRTTVYLSIHFNSLYIHLWMLSNHLSLTFQHLVMVWRWSDADSKTLNCRDNPALLKTNPILFYLFFEAGISHRYLNCFASAWVSVLPNKCRLYSTISALSSLTSADKEICLSPVKMCALCKTN